MDNKCHSDRLPRQIARRLQQRRRRRSLPRRFRLGGPQSSHRRPRHRRAETRTAAALPDPPRPPPRRRNRPPLVQGLCAPLHLGSALPVQKTSPLPHQDRDQGGPRARLRKILRRVHRTGERGHIAALHRRGLHRVGGLHRRLSDQGQGQDGGVQILLPDHLFHSAHQRTGPTHRLELVAGLHALLDSFRLSLLSLRRTFHRGAVHGRRHDGARFPPGLEQGQRRRAQRGRRAQDGEKAPVRKRKGSRHERNNADRISNVFLLRQPGVSDHHRVHFALQVGRGQFLFHLDFIAHFDHRRAHTPLHGHFDVRHQRNNGPARRRRRRGRPLFRAGRRPPKTRLHATAEHRRQLPQAGTGAAVQIRRRGPQGDGGGDLHDLGQHVAPRRRLPRDALAGGGDNGGGERRGRRGRHHPHQSHRTRVQSGGWVRRPGLGARGAGRGPPLPFL
mmetsp:Transcript_17334/g.39126  ORF Transcript_17334/g.39126 Transcript_17334/m.39126 type:complete len:446 (-) Transcript_17334:1123-2460(-)